MTNQRFSAGEADQDEDKDDDDNAKNRKLDALLKDGTFLILCQHNAAILARMEEVTPQWMDDMTTRLFNEIKRQMKIVENSTPGKPSEYAANARTLATLQHTLTETLRMKRDRAMRGESKDTKKNANPKGKIVRSLDRQAAEGTAGRASGRSD
jgi:hypothetical protein